jgi:hypothetical protein
MVKQAMTIYDTIYLTDDDGTVNWCQDRISDTDVEYRWVELWSEVAPDGAGWWWFVGCCGKDFYDNPTPIELHTSAAGNLFAYDASDDPYPLSSWSGRWQRVVAPRPLEGDNGS